jgi:hypothetical protein
MYYSDKFDIIGVPLMISADFRWAYDLICDFERIHGTQQEHILITCNFIIN